MTLATLNEMSIDELWALHENIEVILAAKLTAEKDALDYRLKQLNLGSREKRGGSLTERRPYPKVFPKFRNPDRPSDTWAGRGRLPRWLSDELKSGKRIDDFRIESAAA